MKTYITKSKSGHYTVTVKHEGKTTSIPKMGSLGSARRVAGIAQRAIVLPEYSTDTYTGDIWYGYNSSCDRPKNTGESK